MIITCCAFKEWMMRSTPGDVYAGHLLPLYSTMLPMRKDVLQEGFKAG